LENLAKVEIDPQFREKLRAQLLQKFAVFKLEKSAVKPRPRRFAVFCRRILTTSVAVGAAVLTIFSFPASAERQTIIRNIAGEVQIKTDGAQIFETALEKENLTVGATIRTADKSGAEILFFEDSIVRLDENSQIKITKLTPDSFFGEMGAVNLTLDFGRVWVKSFAHFNKFSRFEISAADAIVFAEAGVFDLQRNKNEVAARVFERKIRILNLTEIDRRQISLFAGKKLAISLSGTDEIKTISAEEKNAPWVARNQFFDENNWESFLTDNFDNNFLQKFTDLLHLNPAQKNLLSAERNFAAAVSLLHESQREAAEKKLEEFSEFLREAVRGNSTARRVAEVSLQNKLKFFQFVLPGDNLFLAKNALQNSLEIVAEDVRLVREQNAKQTLWQAAQFAEKKESNLAEGQLEVFSLQLENLPENETVNPQARAEILEEKSEQLEILSSLSREVQTDSVEEKIISDVAEILNKEKKYLPGIVPRPTIEDLAARVQIYKSKRGRQNATREVLKEFKNDGNELKKLIELRKLLPEDSRLQITQKMIEIIRSEQQKAI
jgi:hypothetical protein